MAMEKESILMRSQLKLRKHVTVASESVTECLLT